MSKFMEQRLQEAVYIERGKNLFNKNAVTQNAYLDANGNIASATGYNISDFISVVTGEQHSYQGIVKIGTATYSAFYDKDKELISTFKQQTNSNTLEIPASAYYVRFTIHNDDLDTFQIEQNSTATSYEAYVEKRLLDVKGEEIVNLDEMKNTQKTKTIWERKCL